MEAKDQFTNENSGEFEETLEKRVSLQVHSNITSNSQIMFPLPTENI